jgi:hypothetical protein
MRGDFPKTALQLQRTWWSKRVPLDVAAASAALSSGGNPFGMVGTRGR